MSDSAIGHTETKISKEWSHSSTHSQQAWENSQMRHVSDDVRRARLSGSTAPMDADAALAR